MFLNLRIHRIEKACSGDEARPAIAQPWLDTDEKALIATNSYILAIVPVELADDDTAGPIPLLALEAARKKSKRNRVAEIACNGTADVADAGATFERPVVEKLPDWKKIANDKPGAPLFKIGLSSGQLYALAQALGTDGVELTVYGGDKKFDVRPLEGEGRGVLMPIRLA